jgi:hypothetical protein
VSGGFVKIYGKILDSSVWSESHATRIVWITMLAMADANGFVEASVGGLARRAQVLRDECEAALKVLQSPDPDDKSGVEEGRRIKPCPRGWLITNHGHYRDLRTNKQVKTAERVRRFRERVTRNAVTLGNALKPPEAEANTNLRSAPTPAPARAHKPAAQPPKASRVTTPDVSRQAGDSVDPDEIAAYTKRYAAGEV